MRTVHKFPIPIEDDFTLEIPAGAKLLHVATQHGQPCLWACVDTEHEPIPYRFWLRGTGHEIAVTRHGAAYLGTFQLEGGALVFHLFYVGAGETP